MENEQEIDDLITLGGCGHVTYWRFPPNLSRCPYNHCKSAFKYRSDLITHYKKMHAPDLILCTICEKPVTALDMNNYYKHYIEKHPGIEPPIKSITQKKQVRIVHLVANN